MPILYKRFIDDCFGVATCPRQQLTEFIDFVSTFHPSIQFTHEISESSIPFLDIRVTISPSSIHLKTSVFYKPTDSHTYLNYSSSHPRSTKTSLPFSQFLRLRRLCSSTADFEQHAEEMSVFFTRQGYCKEVVKNSLQRARDIPRTTALLDKNAASAKENQRPVLAITYHPHNIQIKNILLKNFHIIQSDPALLEIFPKPPLVAYKRDTNLGDHLVHSRLRSPSQDSSVLGTRPCGDRKCWICPYVNPTTTIRGPKSVFTIHRSFNCQSTDVIYAVICSLCSDTTMMLYVGESYRSLSVRGEEHLRAARLGYDTQVGRHFQRPGHSADHFSICAVWQCAGGRSLRKFREIHMANLLGTFVPFGMNIRS